MKHVTCKICGKILERDGLVILDHMIGCHGIGLDKFVNEGAYITRTENISIEKLYEICIEAANEKLDDMDKQEQQTKENND